MDVFKKPQRDVRAPLSAAFITNQLCAPSRNTQAIRVRERVGSNDLRFLFDPITDRVSITRSRHGAEVYRSSSCELDYCMTSGNRRRFSKTY